MKPGIWITWQKHRRTESLCGKLGIELFVFSYQMTGALKYISPIFQTVNCIRREKPRVVFVQNPSLMLCILSSILKFFFDFLLVVDAHNEGVEPYINNRWYFRLLLKFVHKRADLTIVTNSFLGETISKNGGNFSVLPDPVPEIPARAREDGRRDLSKEKFEVVVISTFAEDEPLAIIFDAVNKIDIGMNVKVTGNLFKCPASLKGYENDRIRFLGFLSDNIYWETLAVADLIVDLTLMRYCLVCGSYEAMAVGTPILLTDDPAGREIFRKGVVFTELTVDGVAGNLMRAFKESDNLRLEMTNQKAEYEVFWQTKFNAFLRKVGIHLDHENAEN